MQQARVTGGALLLVSTTHVVLLAALVASAVEQGSLFPLSHLAPYAGANLCVLPFTVLLARLHARSRARARQAEAWLSELESQRQGRRTENPLPRV